MPLAGGHEKREIVYVRPLAWLLTNGYLPLARESEWTLDKGERKLEGWKPGHMYLYTRYLERNGFLAMKDHHRIKAMEAFFLEGNQLYDLLPFPTTDKGPMAQAIRLQNMFMATQRRVIAAGTQLEEALGLVTKAIPRNPDAIRHQETLMRKLITLEERSRYAQPGARDSYWADKFMKSLMLSGATDEFTNEGTRTNTIQKILELQKYSVQGQKICSSDVWHAVKTAHVEVNGGEGENLSGMLQGINTPLARAMLARPPFGDRNGRHQQIELLLCRYYSLLLQCNIRQ
jgi:hypothetical protein